MHLNIIIVFDSGANLIKCVKKKNSTNVLAETRYPDENLESVFVFWQIFWVPLKEFTYAFKQNCHPGT